MTAHDAALPSHAAAALDALNELHAYFWVKDTSRRFMTCTDSFVRLLGYRRREDLIGLRDEDISPEYLVEHYRTYDERILSGGGEVHDLVEIVRMADGAYGWCVTTKWPIFDGDRIVGVAGLTRPRDQSTTDERPEFPFAAALELIATEYGKAISVSDMAAVSNMSVAHFSRRFRDHFGTTPHKYLRGVRLMAVCDMLSTTDMPLSTIAAETGYYDQSHLSNDFVKERHVTPSEYRRQHRRPAPPVRTFQEPATDLQGTSRRSP